MVEALQPGARVDRYVIERVLASGGQGAVARVRHVHLGSQHPLKGLHVTDPVRRARLLREGEIQASLLHPNLLEWLERYVPTTEEVDLIAEQLFAARIETHARGVIHRDLKPGNVLVEQLGDSLQLRVADFGPAVSEGDDESRLTVGGIAMGTPRYMAPEQDVDARTVDVRADVYGLCAVLHELIAGRPPFEPSTVADSYQAAVEERFPPLDELRVGVPARMVAAIAAGLRGASRARPADVVEVRRLWRDGTPVPEAPFGAGAFRAAEPRPEGPVIAITRSPAGAGPGESLGRPSLVPTPSASAPRRRGRMGLLLAGLTGIVLLAGLAGALGSGAMALLATEDRQGAEVDGGSVGARPWRLRERRRPPA